MDKILINLEEDYCRKYFDKDVVSVEDILEKIKEFDDKLFEEKEKYLELENEVKENYRPIPVSTLYGTSDEDFCLREDF